MFKKCLENQIVLQEGQYKCYLCFQKLKQNFDSVLTHLETSVHKQRLFEADEKQHGNDFVNLLEMSETELRRIVENSVTFDKCLNSFYCHLCKSTISELYNTFEHIEDISHRIAVEKFGQTSKIQALNKSKASVFGSDCTSAALHKQQLLLQALEPKLISPTCSLKSNFIICDESYYCTICECKLDSIQNNFEYNQGCILPNAKDAVLKNEIVLEEKFYKSCISEIYCCITCQAFLENSQDVQCHVMIHLFKELPLLNEFDILEFFIGTSGEFYLNCLLCDKYCFSKMSDAHEFLKEHFRTEKHIERLTFFQFNKNDVGLEDMDERIDSLDFEKFSYNATHNICLLKHPYSQYAQKKCCDKQLQEVQSDEIIEKKTAFDPNDVHYYKCFMCLTSFDNAAKLMKHFKTPVHKWKIEALKMIKNSSCTNFIRLGGMEVLVCSLCNKFFKDSQGTMEHILGKRHNKNMKYIPIHQSQSKKLPSNAKSKSLSTLGAGDEEESFATIDLLKGKTFIKFCIDPGQENIYNFDDEKISLLELGTSLTVPHYSDRVCIPCRQKIPADVESMFEHLQNQEHLKIINTIMQIHEEEFGTVSEKFSDLRLAKLYMCVSDQYIQCHACNIKIEDDDDIIREHATGSIHREKSKFLEKKSEQLFKQCLTIYKDIWYYADVFFCDLCCKRFKSEMNFSLHLTHQEHLKKVDQFEQMGMRLKFDLCLPCTTFWFGRDDFYELHYQSEFHRYITKNKDFMVPHLTIAASEFLDNIDKNVDLLVSESDKVDLKIDKETELLKAIVKTVKPKYLNAEAYVFGSRLSHLGFPDSDVDVFLDCNNVYYRGSTKEQNQGFIRNIIRYFECIPKIWNVDEIVLHARVPIMKLRHLPTNLNCDISFVNGLSVEKSRLVGVYNRAFPICRKLILFMKKWLIHCRLFGSNYVTTFAISWCVIFYLQIQGILPSVYELIKHKMESKIVDGWECGFEEIIVDDSSNISFKEHLKRFFTYFANFDYQRKVVSPFLGKTIDKHMFVYTNELAPEIDIYKKRLKQNKGKIFRFDSPMCIQDPIDLSQNLTKAVRKQHLRCFRQYCTLSAEKC